MKLNKDVIAFTGGGTGGHIYPGLAVADFLKTTASEDAKNIKIIWIGCSKGMDKQIIEKAFDSEGNKIVEKFYGIPSGKLRRYFSFKNISDIFRIIGGFFNALHILKKIKPAVLFSKGGFVSVPPCIAAKLLKIPVYTHECDFTLGLANRINFKSAKTMFVSYEDTKKNMSQEAQKRIVVTGNPVRPVFYKANADKGYDFLKISVQNLHKPILLVLGGSSGAKQINDLVVNNLEWLCENYIVVHQTGLVNSDDALSNQLKEKYKDSYKPYSFIYEQMQDVVMASDVILSRAGANSIWESAVLYKPMVLIPLCGNGTRGDQVDNAKFFEDKNAAVVLVGQNANDENLKNALEKMLDIDNRKMYQENVKKMVGEKQPAKEIADLIYQEIK